MDPTDSSTVQAVVDALAVFSRAPDKKALETANSWLQQFQHSVQAWNTCNVLLLSPDSPDSCKTFAAQTFRAKVMYDLKQLPAEQVIPLKDTLINALSTFSGGPRNIRIQIALAIAGLALQSSAWAPTAVQDLISTLGNNPQTVPGLLQFLAVLPSEVSNPKYPVSDEDYHQRAKLLLSDRVDDILKLMLLYTQSPGITAPIQTLIFEVISEWVTAGELSSVTFAQTPLLSFAFEALANQALVDAASELICITIRETQELADNMDAITQILPFLNALRPMIPNLADDPDTMRLYTRIFADAGETYRMLIIQHPETFKDLVGAISECSAYADLDIVNITIPFWYRLGQMIGKQRSVPPMLIEAYQSLFITMVQHCHWPTDVESMTGQEKDDFRGFRHEIGDVLKECATVLGMDLCLEKCYAMLTEALNRGESWQEVEGPLFCVRGLGGKIDWQQQDAVLSKIMQLIPSMPPHPRVRFAATMVLARVTEWLTFHPDLIPTYLTFISGAFEDQDLEVVSAAGSALKYLCKDCNLHLVPYLDQLHQFLASVGSKLAQEDKLAIYEAISHVIQSMPMEENAAALRKFAFEILTTIHATVSKPSGPSQEDRNVIRDALQQLEVMLEIVGGWGEELPLACRDTAASAWSVLEAVIDKYGDTQELSDYVARVLRFGLRMFDSNVLPLIPAILAKLTAKFEETGLANYIWIVGRITQSFALNTDPTIQAAIQTSYELVTAKATKLFTADTIGMHSDVAEDYLFVVTPLLEQNDKLILLSPAFPTTFTILSSALQLFNTDIVFKALGLIRMILDHDSLTGQNANVAPHLVKTQPEYGLYINAINLAVQKEGLNLVGYLLAGLVDHFIPEMLSGVITTLRILTGNWTTEMTQWVPRVFEHLPISPALEEARLQFLNDYNNVLTSGNLDGIKPAVSNLQRAALRAKDRRRGFDRL